MNALTNTSFFSKSRGLFCAEKAAKGLAFFFLLTGLSFCSSSCSTSTTLVTKTTNQKIAVYDAREIMLKSDWGVKAKIEHQDKANKRKAEIQKVENDLRARKNHLEKNKTSALESDYRVRFENYKELVRISNEELKHSDATFRMEITPHILKVVEKIKTEEKYDALLDTNSQVQGINYSKDQDITDRVMNEFNAYTRMNQESLPFAK